MFVAFVGASPSVTSYPSLVASHSLDCISKGVSTVFDGLGKIFKGFSGLFLGSQQYGYGDFRAQAATSCQQIASLRPGVQSGYYWIQENSVPVRVYCQMGRGACGEGAWMQVANVNMTEINSKCPSGLELITSPKRLCRKNVNIGCSSSNFSTHSIPFSKVCGQVIGYQHHTTNAFDPYYTNPSLTIDDVYVDGVSITYSSHPRQHIWTFAAAFDERPSNPRYSCPCVTSIPRSRFTGRIPPFIGTDYYCETGSRTAVTDRYYLADPLWDGKGCGNVSTCCEGTMKPWFLKMLQQPVSSNIEVRVCTDQAVNNEDVVIEIISIFVQ